LKQHEYLEFIELQGSESDSTAVKEGTLKTV